MVGRDINFLIPKGEVARSCQATEKGKTELGERKVAMKGMRNGILYS
jgi:hypothetical protein